MLETINIEQELQRFFDDVISKSKTNLKRGNNNASGHLSRSLDYNINVSKNSIQSDFLMPDYGDFVDKGVKGTESGRSLAGYKYRNKKPPVRFLRTFIKQKTGRFRQRGLTQKAFAIQNVIFKRGLKPTEFYSKPFKEAFKKLPDELVEAFALDVDDFMEFVLKNNLSDV